MEHRREIDGVMVGERLGDVFLLHDLGVASGQHPWRQAARFRRVEFASRGERTSISRLIRPERTPRPTAVPWGYGSDACVTSVPWKWGTSPWGYGNLRESETKVSVNRQPKVDRQVKQCFSAKKS